MSAIALDTTVSNDVVDILRARIENLSPQVRQVLVLAAFVGFLVDVQLLEMLVESSDVMAGLKEHMVEKQIREVVEESMLSVTEALRQAEAEGLIDVSDAVSRFSHDRIQECLYALVPEGKGKEKLHYQIGMQTWNSFKESDNPYIFLAADQLNRGSASVRQGSDKMFLVEINYNASLVAKKRVGIETVGSFIEKAIEHIVDESYWERSYNLLIDLYGFASEVECSRGNFGRSEAHVEVVLKYAKKQRDTVRARVPRALAYGVKREFARAIQECRILLSLIGVNMPRSSTINFLFEVVRTKILLKKRSDVQLLRMRNMESGDMVLAMKILQHGSIFGWNSDTTFAGLCYLRMIRLTAEHGWCEVTPYSLAGYGFLLAALGQEEDAFRFSQLALRSSRRGLAQPDVNMMVHSFLAHFELPAAQSLSPLIAGYRAGLETGEMMCGSICMSVYAHVYLFSGLQLDSFAKDMFQFTEQLKLCHQDLALAFILPALQLALNLSGETSNPADISNESMKALDAYNDSMFVDTTTEDPTITFVYYLQAFSGFLLEDMDLASQALNRLSTRQMKRLEGTQILNLLFILIDGLVGFSLYRKDPRRKYWKLARSAIKDLEALVKKRSINCGGILSLLKAEEASFINQKDNVVKYKYDNVSPSSTVTSNFSILVKSYVFSVVSS